MFSPDAFNRIDPRSTMYTCPCVVFYHHQAVELKENFFRTVWRFNKRTINPLVTTVGPSHQDASLDALNRAFQRMNSRR